MKYYARKILKREPVNRFGKIGFNAYVEAFKTNSTSRVEELNKGKRVFFYENGDEVIKHLVDTANVRHGTVLTFPESEIEKTRALIIKCEEDREYIYDGEGHIIDINEEDGEPLEWWQK